MGEPSGARHASTLGQPAGPVKLTVSHREPPDVLGFHRRCLGMADPGSPLLSLLPALAMGVVLTVRRDLPLALAPLTGSVLLLAAVAAGLVPRATRRLVAAGAPATRHRRLWAVPLSLFAAQVALLVLVAGAPTLAGRPDGWPRLLDLPPRLVARMVTDVFLLAVASIVTGFVLSAGDLLRGPRRPAPPRPGRDLATTAGLLAVTLLLGGLLLQWRLALPDNLLFVRALWSLETGAPPRQALALLATLIQDHPGSSLVDSALARSARILEEDLGDDEGARELYARLLAERPDSPWCDDAAFGLVRLAFRRPGPPSAVVGAAESLVASWPDSPWADDALLVALRASARADRVDDAKRLMGILETRYAKARCWDETPERYPWCLRPTVDLAREALGNDG